jgi:hypothetical protein
MLNFNKGFQSQLSRDTNFEFSNLRHGRGGGHPSKLGQGTPLLSAQLIVLKHFLLMIVLW